MDSPEAVQPSSYEFGPKENETVGKAARWIGFWAWVSIGAGIVSGVAGLFAPDPGDRIGGLITGGIYVLIGIYFRSAAGSMQSVVTTRGNDVAHLMSALDRLASAFKVMGVLVIVMVSALLLLLLVAGGAMVASGG